MMRNSMARLSSTGAPARSKPDRVFVIQWYVPRHVAPDTDILNGFFTFNGMPWPNTERLHYAQGDSVRWRFINASGDTHPLHLHGFYYRVAARGDDIRDTLYWPAQQRMAVTELMLPQTTMDMAWYADRPGGWIFHCHLNFHVIRIPRLARRWNRTAFASARSSRASARETRRRCRE